MAARAARVGRGGGAEVTAVGAGGHVAVLLLKDATGEDRRTAYGIGIGSGGERPRLLWTAHDFDAQAVADGAVVGVSRTGTGTGTEDPLGRALTRERLTAVDLVTGERLWRDGTSASRVRAEPFGSSLVHVHGRGGGGRDEEEYDGILAPRTGKAAFAHAPWLPGTCSYDARDTVVCAGPGTVQGLDARSAKVLWKLPHDDDDGGGGDDGNAAVRTVPTVTAVWHGRVYGETARGPVLLDARTGTGLPAPGIAPVLLNAYAGIVAGNGGLVAYRTSGGS